MKLINLCPHPVRFLFEGGNFTQLDRCENPARVSKEIEFHNNVETPFGDVPCFTHIHGEVENMPPPKKGVLYIIPRMVSDAVPERRDIAIPDNIVREKDPETGKVFIKGCKSLAVRPH